MRTLGHPLDEGRRILTDSRRAVETAERLRLIRGASDVNHGDHPPHRESPAPDKAALLTKLLLETRPLCVACISSTSGLLVGEIEPVVSRLEQTIFVKREMGPCRTCDRWTLVYSLFGKPEPS
jgi:hypothetical protein